MTSLRIIDDGSFPDDPLFALYPGMKIGVRQSVAFFVDRLWPAVLRLLETRPEDAVWTLTSPPRDVAPAGANLMADGLHERMVREGLADRVHRVDLYYRTPRDQDNPARRDYAKADAAHREAARRALHVGPRAPVLDPDDFSDRAVLVVNDICVTGTQQRYMRRDLLATGAVAAEWLYVFQVDPELARSDPGIESRLNRQGLETFGRFAHALETADIDFTARCISRLLQSPTDQVASMAGRMDAARRRRLAGLAEREAWHRGIATEARPTLDALGRDP